MLLYLWLLINCHRWPVNHDFILSDGYFFSVIWNVKCSMTGMYLYINNKNKFNIENYFVWPIERPYKKYGEMYWTD